MLKANQDLIVLDTLATAYKAQRETMLTHEVNPVQLAILFALAATSSKGIPYLTAREVLYYTWLSDTNEYVIYKALQILGDEARPLIEKQIINKLAHYSITPQGLTIVKHCINLSKQYTDDYNTLAESI